MILEIDKYLKERRGAIHVGGHDGEERDFYKSFRRATYFEPNKELFKRLCSNIKVYENQFALNWGVHDKLNFADLNVSNNDGQSSSILDLGLHSKYHPDVHYIRTEQINLVRLDWVFDTFLSVENYNFLNIDVQGVELNVIKSTGDYISHFDYIYCEVNRQELYKGCALIDEIDAYLALYGFKRHDTKWTKANWGDAIYIKENLI